jgi:acetyltransferase-like isoleucine patch superfamily enzyme
MKTPFEIIVQQDTVNDDFVHIQWLVSSGDFVNKEDIIVEIETSKSTIEIEAEQDGFLEIILPDDSDVNIGDLIGIISDNPLNSTQANKEQPPLNDTITQKQIEETVPVNMIISGKAKSLIEKHKISPSSFKGLDFVKESDVKEFLNKTKDSVQEVQKSKKTKKSVDEVTPNNKDILEKELSIWQEAKKASKDRERNILWLILNYIFRNWFLNGLVRITPYGLIIWVHKLRGVSIGKGCFIDPSATLETAYPENIKIGNDVRVTAQSIIMTHIKAPNHLQEIGFVPVVVKPVVLEDYCFIGVNSTIMPGVTIGKGAVVGSGSVVVSNVPAYSMVIGNPAKVVKKFV